MKRFARRTRQARGVGSKFNHWAKRGVRAKLFEQLKLRVKGADLECLMIESAAAGNHNPATGAKGGNRSIGKTAGCPTTQDAHDGRRRGNPLDFTVTAGNVHDSKETRNLIQILEENSLPKNRKHDVEERGQRDFLGDRRYAGSVIERISAVIGWIRVDLFGPRPQKRQEPPGNRHGADNERRKIKPLFERIKRIKGA